MSKKKVVLLLFVASFFFKGQSQNIFEQIRYIDTLKNVVRAIYSDTQYWFHVQTDSADIKKRQHQKNLVLFDRLRTDLSMKVDSSLLRETETALLKADSLKIISRAIMNLLSSFDSYEKMELLLKGRNLMDSIDFLNLGDRITSSLDKVQLKMTILYGKEIETKNRKETYLIIFIIIALVTLLFSVVLLMIKNKNHTLLRTKNL